jgi:ribonuclease HII
VACVALRSPLDYKTTAVDAHRPQDAAGSMICVGIDENGLGPRLGPLVVTAVMATVTDEARKRVEARPRGGARSRLGDSKRLVAYGDSALGEAWARAIARRMGLASATSPQALVQALSLDPDDTLRALCPSSNGQSHARQCWSAEGEGFVADEPLVAHVEKDLARLSARGITVEHTAVVVTCTRRLNDAVAQGLSRFDVDLHAMERLTLDARARAGRDVVSTCGKVGGYDRYPQAFGPLAGRLHAVVIEGRARSEYAIPGLGRIAFVRDADDRHLLVSMASLVGKWTRDLLMARIVRYHREHDAGLPDASGYHDPVTARFVEATRLHRKRRLLPDECFERRALGSARPPPGFDGFGGGPDELAAEQRSGDRRSPRSRGQDRRGATGSTPRASRPSRRA